MRTASHRIVNRHRPLLPKPFRPPQERYGVERSANVGKFSTVIKRSAYVCLIDIVLLYDESIGIKNLNMARFPFKPFGLDF